MLIMAFKVKNTALDSFIFNSSVNFNTNYADGITIWELNDGVELWTVEPEDTNG